MILFFYLFFLFGTLRCISFRKDMAIGFAQDLHIAFQLSLLAAFFPYFLTFPILTILISVAIIDCVYVLNLHGKFPIRSLYMLTNMDSMWATLKEVSIIPVLFGLAMIITVTGFAALHPLPLIPSALLALFSLPLGMLPIARNSNNYIFLQEKLLINILYRKDTQTASKPKFLNNRLREGQRLFDLPYDKQNPPHVIVVIMESFRSANVGCLGAKIPVTPNFDRFAKEGILFSNFSSNATQTFKGLFHILQGLPAAYGSDYEKASKKVIQLPLIGMAEMFKNSGYETSFIHNGSNAFDHQGDFLMNHGFDELIEKMDILQQNPNAHGNSWGVYDEYLMQYTLDRFKDQENPLFATLLTMTNHHPYRVPLTTSYKPPNDVTNELYKKFLCTMNYSDHALGLLIDGLKKQNTNAYLIITGDHSFPMRERFDCDFYQGLYQEQISVPLLIYDIQNRIKTQQITTPASHIDILPTVVDLFNLKGKHEGIGTSLAKIEPDNRCFLLTEAVNPTYGMRKGSWKYFYNQEEKFLFHLINDPDEMKNLAKQNEAVTNEMHFETEQVFDYTKRILKEKAQKQHSKHKILDLRESILPKEDLETIIQNKKNLQVINLSGFKFFQSLPTPLPPTLKELYLDNLLLLMDNDLRALPKSIKTLSLLGTELTDQALENIIEIAPKLQRLNIDCRKFSAPMMNQLAKNLKSIRFLHLEYCHSISDDFFSKLPNPTLQTLILENPKQFTDSALRFLSSHPIETLEIYDAKNFTDEGISYITEMPIRNLELHNATKITDNGLSCLKDVPLQITIISNADLITDVGLNYLRGANTHLLQCKNCKQLKSEISGKTDRKFVINAEEKDLFD